MGKRKNEEPDPRQPAQQAPGTLSKPAIPFIGKFLKGRGELRIVQYSVPARFSGRFPPDLSPLLGLGFGMVGWQVKRKQRKSAPSVA